MKRHADLKDFLEALPQRLDTAQPEGTAIGAQYHARSVTNDYRFGRVLDDCSRQAFVRKGDLTPLLLREIGDNRAEAIEGSRAQRATRNQHRNQRARRGTHPHLGRRVAVSGSIQQLTEHVVVIRNDEIVERPAGEARIRLSKKTIEPGVAIQHRAIGAQHERSVAHLLDQHSIGLVGGDERVDLRTIRAVDNDRIDLSASNGAQGFFRFFQSLA